MQTKESLRHQKRMAKIAQIQEKQKNKIEEKQALEKYSQKKKFSTSKLFVIGIFIVAIQVIIFSEVFMWYTMDSSSLYALIGIAAGISGASASLLGYFSKSKAENTEGGIVYDQAMQNFYTPPEQPVVNQDNDQAVG